MPNQNITSIFVFALTILFFCVIIVPGENLWKILHDFTLGIFGFYAILYPILFLTVLIFEKFFQYEKTDKKKFKFGFAIFIITLFSTVTYVFSPCLNFTKLNFFKQLIMLYNDGVKLIGAGAFGGLFGIPLIWAFGVVGARIFLGITLFILLMFFTKTSLSRLFRIILKPFKFLKKCWNSWKILNIDSYTDKNDENTCYNSKKKFKDYLKTTNSDDFTNKTSGGINADVRRSSGVFEHIVQVTSEFMKKCRKKNINSTSLLIKKESFQDVQSYVFPSVDLLNKSEILREYDISQELQNNGQMLVDTLKNFNVETKIINISRGPTVTRYELQPAAGVKISKITNLADDIALSLAAVGVRIEAPILGKAAVGVEVPNKTLSIVNMRELISSQTFEASESKLTVVLGRDISGKIVVSDLAKMPHLLIAGSTGSGKSVCINSFIISLLYKASPEEIRLLMIDPKIVELGIYNEIPHLLAPVVTVPQKAARALNWAVNEMSQRYEIFAENNVRDITSYNQMIANNDKLPDYTENRPKKMSKIIIIIDELSDLMMAAPNEIEDYICRLAQMARAAGIHLVIATQRPSVDVITGTIKANVPSRIALAVSSQIDSRTILDMCGAEKLLGRGDMLFSLIGKSKPIRIQGCYVADAEIEKIVKFVKKSQKYSYNTVLLNEIEKNRDTIEKKNFISDGREVKILQEAVKCVISAGQASNMILQNKLKIRLPKVKQLLEEMEHRGIVGPADGLKPRKVLISSYRQFLELNSFENDKILPQK